MSLFTLLFATAVKKGNLSLFQKVLSGFGKGLDKKSLLKQLNSVPAKARKQLENDFRQIMTSVPNIKGSLKLFLNKPEAFSRALSTMKSSELKKIEAMVGKEITKRKKQSEDAKEENRLKKAQEEYTYMNSSWIAEMWYDNGTMYIRTHSGWEGALRDQIKYSTFEAMVKAKGQNGSGSGSVLWANDWAKYKSKRSKKQMKKNVVYRTAT